MKNLKARFSHWKISSQISLNYALILFGTMIFTNAAITAGVHYSFYHQAERAIEISIEHITKNITEIKTVDENIYQQIMPSVILRVTDNLGKTIVDSNPYFPTVDKMLAYVRKDPPFWSNGEFKLIETPHSLFYYKSLPLEVGGKIFNFHFIRTITFEKQFVRYLMLTLFVIEMIGLGLAVMTGHVLGRKVLKPLRQVTKTAREISAGNLNKRLTIEQSGEEVNELADTFNTMLDRLEKTFNQQQRFIADASHELRTPITIIRGYADILESYGADDPEIVAEASTAIKNSAQNMQFLVENLLFLARADQGTQPLDRSPVEINELLKSVIASFKNPRIEFEDAKAIEIIGDAQFLKKMFAAFIDNALMYSNDNVTVALETTENNIAVKFIDSGIGIAPENIGKIFDRFFRADKSRVKSDGNKINAGLGLSIAKWIAEAHNIKIDVDSEIGKGTTFTLTFPH